MFDSQKKQGLLIAAVLCAVLMPRGSLFSAENGSTAFSSSRQAVKTAMVQAAPAQIPQAPIPSAAKMPVSSDETHLEHSISLDELAAAAVERHPSVIQARSLCDAAYGGWIQAGLKANPEIGYVSDEMGGYKEWGTQTVGVTQEIISQEKRSARRAAAASEQQVARQNINLYSAKAANDALLAGYTVLIAQNKVQTAEELLLLCRKSSETVQALVQAGEASASELMVDQVDQMEAESTLAQAKLEYETAQDNIAILLGEPLATRYTIRDRLDQFPLELDAEELWSQIREESPAIRLARAEQAAAVARLNQQMAEAKVNVTGAAGVQYNTYEYQTEAAVGFSIPVRVNDRNQGNILKARYEVQAAEANIRRVEMTLQKKFQTRLFEFQSARKKVLLYRESLLEKVNQAFEAVSEAYAHKEAAYIEQLAAERALKKVRMNYLDDLHTLIISRILLNGFLLDNADE